MDINNHPRIVAFLEEARAEEQPQVYDNLVKLLEAVPEEDAERTSPFVLLKQARKCSSDFQKMIRSIERHMYIPFGAVA